MSTVITQSAADMLLDSLAEAISRDGARRLLTLRASTAVQARVNELSEKSSAGDLSDEEKEEYEDIVRVSTFIATLQAKARRLLNGEADSQ